MMACISYLAYIFASVQRTAYTYGVLHTSIYSHKAMSVLNHRIIYLYTDWFRELVIAKT